MPTTATLYIGATQIVTQTAAPIPQIVDVASSGTVALPSNAKYAFLECIGAGQGGVSSNSPGGAGGNYACAYVTAAQYGASQAVTIGAGGALGGATGGNTSIGTLVTANGGQTVQPANNNPISSLGGIGGGLGGGTGGSSPLGAGGGGGQGSSAPSTGGVGGTANTGRDFLQAGNGANGGNVSATVAGVPGGGGGSSMGGTGGSAGANGAARITFYF